MTPKRNLRIQLIFLRLRVEDIERRLGQYAMIEASNSVIDAIEMGRSDAHSALRALYLDLQERAARQAGWQQAVHECQLALRMYDFEIHNDLEQSLA